VSKAEELRDKIYTKAAKNINRLRSEFSCGSSDDRAYDAEERELATDLYALISAAHAEGVAEERKRLMSLLALLVMYEGVVPASVLAPKEQGETKETAFDKAGVTLRGQHGMDW
jgi:hypothetical protein